MTSNEELSTVMRLSDRLSPQNAAAKGSTSARRSLFGPTDHQENVHVQSELSDQLYQRAKNRWNFDFRTCTPLPGRFEWSHPVAVDDGEPAVAADDVSNRVNDNGSGVEIINETAKENNSRMGFCGKTSSSFATPLPSPTYEQTISCFMRRRQSRKIIRKLTWAPKKKIGFLSRTSSRRTLRHATVPDYFPVKKRLEF